MECTLPSKLENCRFFFNRLFIIEHSNGIIDVCYYKNTDRQGQSRFFFSRGAQACVQGHMIAYMLCIDIRYRIAYFEEIPKMRKAQKFDGNDCWMLRSFRKPTTFEVQFTDSSFSSTGKAENLKLELESCGFYRPT